MCFGSITTAAAVAGAGKGKWSDIRTFVQADFYRRWMTPNRLFAPQDRTPIALSVRTEYGKSVWG